MFYYNFVNLCNKRDVSPSAAAEEMGFHRSDVTRWSKGSVPRQSTLQRIADYFGVPVGYLTEDGKKSPRTDTEGIDPIGRELLERISKLSPAKKALVLEKVMEIEKV